MCQNQLQKVRRNLFGAVNDMVSMSSANNHSLTYVEPVVVFFALTCSRQTHSRRSSLSIKAEEHMARRQSLPLVIGNVWRIAHDKIKRDYCKHHRIPLLCSSYRESVPKALQHFIKANKINIMKPKPVVTKTKPSWSFFAIVLLVVLFGTLAKPET